MRQIILSSVLATGVILCSGWGRSSAPSASPSPQGYSADAQTDTESRLTITRPTAVARQVSNSIGMKMIPIPAGEFQMGSDRSEDSDASDDEQPRHEVKIGRSFSIAAHKTTQEQFEKVLGRNPSCFSATGSGKDKVVGLDTTRFPVDTETFFDAVEFCIKLSQQESRRPCYRLSGVERTDDGSITKADIEVLTDGTGYRLPTEAEWEYCARAGQTSRYSFGNDAGELGEYAWFSTNGGGRTHPVGEKKPNAWKLYDMGGLLYERCEDVYHRNYNGAPADGSAWRTGGEPSQRVVRGGSFGGGGTRDCRPAHRYTFALAFRYNLAGFRVVLVFP